MAVCRVWVGRTVRTEDHKARLTSHVRGDGEPELDAGQEEHVGVAFREAPGPALPRGLVTELPVLEGQPPVLLWPQRHKREERQLQEEDDHDHDSESKPFGAEDAAHAVAGKAAAPDYLDVALDHSRCEQLLGVDLQRDLQRFVHRFGD